MKIKFEVKPNPKQVNPNYIIMMEHQGEDNVEFKLTKFELRQAKMFNKNPVMQGSEFPIPEGLMVMSKANIKKFIAVLQLLVKA